MRFDTLDARRLDRPVSEAGCVFAPPLPRPKPSLHYATGDNPAALISAFRHQHGEGSVAIDRLTRVAQEQANAMAVRDLLDHNALVTSVFGTLRPSALVVLRFPQYGWPPAVGVSHNTTRTNAPVTRYGQRGALPRRG
mgnify:CR=1 FL=1